MSAPAGKKTRRLPELDGLRAVAIIMVLLDHFFSHFFPSAAVRSVTAYGWSGVDLFFVLSGFLIGGILMDQRGASNYYRVFYIRRFFRIIPLYSVMLIPAFVVLGFGLQSHFKSHSLGTQTASAMLLYFCMMQNLGNGLLFNTPHYLSGMWSLAVEEQFYLLLPPLVRRLSPERLLQVTIAGIVVAPLIRGAWFLILPGQYAGPASYVLLISRWDSLLMGVLSAYLVRNGRAREWLVKRFMGLRVAWVILVAGMLAMPLTGFSKYGPQIGVGGYSWIAAFFTCTLLLATLNTRGVLNRCLSFSILAPIATVSYGLYLLQGPAVVIRSAMINRLGLPEIGWAATGINVLALAATAVAAAISWKFFESRMIQVGHRYSYRKSGPSPSKEHAPEPGATSNKPLIRVIERPLTLPAKPEDCG